jgi:hypothetical protein
LHLHFASEANASFRRTSQESHISARVEACCLALLISSEVGLSKQPQSMAFEEKVFKLDRRIRYCGVLDEMGRETSGGMRPGVKSLEPEDEAERVNLQVALTRGMGESARSYFGMTDYVIIHRERLMLIALPRPDRKTVLVGAEPDFPLNLLKTLIEIVASNYPT